jgi:DNA processing protein
MTQLTEMDALLILNAVPGLNPRKTRELKTEAGSYAKILSLSAEQLSRAQFPSQVIERLLKFSSSDFLTLEWQKIKKSSVHIITIDDPRYPQSLSRIFDAPLVLYVRGEVPSDDMLSLAIVGARNASIYGMTTAERFAMRLTELGFVVVSGLARGIDTYAHRGALRSRGVTVAVLGSGLGMIYPSENTSLAEEICEHGALISEFPMSTPPIPYNFPRRNRIISALSLGVVVVEAAQRSGALITADFALEQGKEVYAVPGKVDHPASVGVNKLIQQGAKLVMDVDDILEDLAPALRGENHAEKNLASDLNIEELTEDESALYDLLTDQPAHIDELSNRNLTAVSRVSSLLVQLEMKRFVKQLPGKVFVRHDRKSLNRINERTG